MSSAYAYDGLECAVVLIREFLKTPTFAKIKVIRNKNVSCLLRFPFDGDGSFLLPHYCTTCREMAGKHYSDLSSFGCILYNRKVIAEDDSILPLIILFLSEVLAAAEPRR